MWVEDELNELDMENEVEAGPGAMPSQFRLSLAIVQTDGGQPVCYKQDGQRFGQAHTVKLNVNTNYTVRVTLRPALNINKMMIQGESHGVEVEKSSKSHHDDNKRTYRTSYDTSGHDTHTRSNRKELAFLFELDDGVYMKTALQCKFYRRDETDHSRWGQKLSAIEYECHVQKGHNFVSMTKEKYL